MTTKKTAAKVASSKVPAAKKATPKLMKEKTAKAKATANDWRTSQDVMEASRLIKKSIFDLDLEAIDAKVNKLFSGRALVSAKIIDASVASGGAMLAKTIIDTINVRGELVELKTRLIRTKTVVDSLADSARSFVMSEFAEQSKALGSVVERREALRSAVLGSAAIDYEEIKATVLIIDNAVEHLDKTGFALKTIGDLLGLSEKK